MKRTLCAFLWLGLLLALSMIPSGYSQVTTSKDVLLDKIRGGWLGKVYGVTFGGPTEFRYMGTMVEKPLQLEKEEVPKVLRQDDIYVNMVFLEALADSGLDAPASVFANKLAYAGFGLGHANSQARQNLLAGISPEKSGHPHYTPQAEDIDFQIEADFIGLVCPGLPKSAQKIGNRVGHIMNYGDGVYGGIFVAAMYSAAFICDDVRQIVESGLRAIPENSGYARTIRDVIRWHDRNPWDWKITWLEIQKKYGHLDLCPWGVTGAHGSLKGQFNISARMNGAYIVLGLLYGNQDIEKTIEIATRAGQDSDCNPATAGGIVGVLLGFEKMPESMKSAFKPIMNEKFSHVRYSFESASEECLKLSVENILANGGKDLSREIQINAQPFECKGPVEVAFPTLTPSDAFWITDNRIVWQGDWKTFSDRPLGTDDLLWSEKAGDFMEVKFPGTAIYVEGRIRYDFGILEFLIDGKSMGTRDMFMPKKWQWGGGQLNAVWITGLPDGIHTLRVVVTGKKNPQSEGTKIGLGRIACYRGEIAE